MAGDLFRLRYRVALVVATASLAAIAMGCGGAAVTARPPQPRPTRWASPLPRPGVPNLHRVNENLYRGAQPTVEGFRQLKALGVKTVLNLRSAHSDADELGDTGLAYEHIWFRTWHPEDEDVVRFLRIVTDPENAPVFVHCRRGADRTGMMCAIYRVVVCRWSKDDAIEEMIHGDFGFDPRFQNLIDYVREMDVDTMRQQIKQEGRRCGQ